jgi:hypothetical protein
MQFENAQDIVQPWFTTFLYGPTGSGKTYCAGGFPMPLFIVPRSENSILTMRGQDVIYKKIDSTKEALGVIDHLLSVQHKDGPKALPCETVVMESLSHYTDMLVEEISASRKGQMDQQGWGQVAAHFRAMHQKLTQLECHIIYTALADHPNAESGTPGRPLIQGRAREILPSACDVVAFADVRGAKYSVYTVPTRNYYARTRLQLPSEVVMSSPTALYDAIRDSVVVNRLAAAGGDAGDQKA